MDFIIAHQDNPGEALATVTVEHEPWEENGDAATQAHVWAEDLGLDVVEADFESRTVFVQGEIDFVIARLTEQDV